jgi:anti-anti-sigma factor
VALDISSEVIGRSAHVTLSGELDSSTAPSVRQIVDKVLADSPINLILHLENLSFMASAGLRVIIFAKQKAPDLKVYVVKPQDTILETLRKTGFYSGVYVVDEAPVV